MSAPKEDTIPSVVESLRRLSDQRLHLLVHQMCSLADSFRRQDDEPGANVMAALVVHIGDEQDRRRIALHEIEWAMDDFQTGEIVDEDPST